MSKQLPLFPLSTVLFPGLSLPLHIFEDHYRLLIRNLIESPKKTPPRFGVVTVKHGQPAGSSPLETLYEIGCTAELLRAHTYDDGHFDIVVTGENRFLLHRIDNSRPYFQGEVEFLDEQMGHDAIALAPEVAQLFRNYRALVLAAQGQFEETPLWFPDDPVVVSYLVAAATVLPLPDKHKLLAATDAAARLKHESELLQQEIAILKRLPSLPAVELLRRVASLN